ncbi:MAG: AraC family transcriptional regulator [Lachnospiraceae bacterium]|nr:AraC family transcriptional regulator [Lachnospiraceae bacterium]
MDDEITVENVNYIYDDKNGIEIILSRQSEISYPLHNHVSVFTFGVVLEGEVAIEIAGHRRTYIKGQSYGIPPYMPHQITAVLPYTMLTVCIPKECWKQEADYVCQKDYEAKEGKLTNLLGSELKEKLERFPEERITVEEMARLAAVSKYHFIRLFKQEMGMTPHQFQLQNRIRKAQRLLKQSEAVTKVAMEAGFCDQSHFIRQFEKTVGLKPTAYKKVCFVLD